MGIRYGQVCPNLKCRLQRRRKRSIGYKVKSTKYSIFGSLNGGSSIQNTYGVMLGHARDTDPLASHVYQFSFLPRASFRDFRWRFGPYRWTRLPEYRLTATIYLVCVVHCIVLPSNDLDPSTARYSLVASFFLSADEHTKVSKSTEALIC
jgi:hypothetical protein